MKYLTFTLLLAALLFSCKKDSDSPSPEEIIIESEVEYKDVACAECKFVVQPSAWQVDGSQEQLKTDGTMAMIEAGDTIGISGERGGIQFINLLGAEGKPIVIINCDGTTTLGTSAGESKGLHFINSKYFVVSGAGSTSETYGIKLIGYFGIEISEYSSDFEIMAVEVLAAGYVGIAARTNPPPYPDCIGAENPRDVFVQRNSILHDNYIHNTEGEGFYIGGSHWYKLWDENCPGVYEPELHGVRIYNNRMENIGMDGIQVGSATQDVKIFNNQITNFGTRSIGGHMSGFQINPGTTGEIYNNVINTGNGFAIFMVGKGDNLIYNNLIIKPSFDGIYTQDRSPVDNAGFYIINNTIIEPGEKGIGWNSFETSNNVIYNNIIYKPGKAFIGSDGHNNNYSYEFNLELSNDEGIEFGENYELLSGSVKAIDQGRDVLESYGIDFDIQGNKRPDGNGFDIGAYEYVE